jgi:hypothetical protein
MRLGTETGSVMNHLQARMVDGEPVPTIGMGATLLGWTDRYPATIVQVWVKRPGKPGELAGGLTPERQAEGYEVARIELQEDRAKLIGGSEQSEAQEYEFTPNPQAALKTFRKNKAGLWRQVVKGESGRWCDAGGKGLRIGERDAYRDPTF